MQLKSLNHMGLVVTDLDRTRTFYIDFLGMKELARPSNFLFGGAWFGTGAGYEIHVILAADTSADAGIPEPGVGKTEGLSTHFAFEVDDLDGYIARAKVMGIQIVGGPLNRGLGAKQLYTQDPDGYQVELFERTDEQASDRLRHALRG
ncbi:MAG: VOC family protein [Chloroflexota bacterium]